MIKSLARKTIDFGAYMFGPHRWPNRPGQLVVLTYHRVLPRSYEDLSYVEPGMYVHDDTFDMHLQVLREYFRIVDLDEWLSDGSSDTFASSRCCAITFDDGWSDNFQYAYPILRRHGARATVFLTSDFIGTNYRFWPDRVARAVVQAVSSEQESKILKSLIRKVDGGGNGAGREQISRVIAAVKTLDTSRFSALMNEVDNIVSNGSTSVDRDLLDWDEVRSMHQSGLVKFGSHTKRHMRLLPSVDNSTVSIEVADSKTDIEAAIGAPVSLFCYPNGDLSDDSEIMVRQHYSGACIVEPGWNKPATDPYRIRRMSIHEDRTNSRVRLMSKLSGWL